MAMDVLLNYHERFPLVREGAAEPRGGPGVTRPLPSARAQPIPMGVGT